MEGIEAAGGESLQLGLASVYSGSHGGKREPMEVDLRREEDQKLMNQGQRFSVFVVATWICGRGVGVLE